MSSIVRVEPSNLEFEVPDGTSILQAARQAGLSWPSVCGGLGECTTCHFVVVAGIEHLQVVSRRELDALSRIMRRFPAMAPGMVRLACQSMISGDVVVRKVGVISEQE